MRSRRFKYNKNKIELKYFKLFTIGFFLLFAVPQQTSAQAFVKNYEFGIWAGIDNYFGDLNQAYNFKGARPAGGAFFKYNFNPYLGWRTTVSYGYLQFSDDLTMAPYNNARNLSFFTNLIDGNTSIEINFKPYNHKDKEAHFAPYITFGVGFYHYEPKAKLDGTTYSLRPLGTEGQNQTDFTNRKPYNNFQMNIPFGIGFRQYLGGNTNLGFELVYRKTFNDYIDDVSTQYVDDFILVYLTDPNNEGAAAVALADPSDPDIGYQDKQRGFSTTNDSYIFIGLTLSYTINTNKCPKGF